MAVNKVATIDVYVGLSTDIKPTSPRIGSRFSESDSGRNYVFSSAGWVEDMSEPASTSMVKELHDQARRLAEQELLRINVLSDSGKGYHNFGENR